MEYYDVPNPGKDAPVSPLPEDDDSPQDNHNAMPCSPPAPLSNLMWALSTMPFNATNSDELSVEENEQLVILDTTSRPGWWKVVNGNGQSGYVPDSCLERCEGDSEGSSTYDGEGREEDADKDDVGRGEDDEETREEQVDALEYEGTQVIVNRVEEEGEKADEALKDVTEDAADVESLRGLNDKEEDVEDGNDDEMSEVEEGIEVTEAVDGADEAHPGEADDASMEVDEEAVAEPGDGVDVEGKEDADQGHTTAEVHDGASGIEMADRITGAGEVADDDHETTVKVAEKAEGIFGEGEEVGHEGQEDVMKQCKRYTVTSRSDTKLTFTLADVIDGVGARRVEDDATDVKAGQGNGGEEGVKAAHGFNDEVANPGNNEAAVTTTGEGEEEALLDDMDVDDGVQANEAGKALNGDEEEGVDQGLVENDSSIQRSVDAPMTATTTADANDGRPRRITKPPHRYGFYQSSRRRGPPKNRLKKRNEGEEEERIYLKRAPSALRNLPQKEFSIEEIVRSIPAQPGRKHRLKNGPARKLKRPTGGSTQVRAARRNEVPTSPTVILNVEELNLTPKSNDGVPDVASQHLASGAAESSNNCDGASPTPLKSPDTINEGASSGVVGPQSTTAKPSNKRKKAVKPSVRRACPVDKDAVNVSAEGATRIAAVQNHVTKHYTEVAAREAFALWKKRSASSPNPIYPTSNTSQSPSIPEQGGPTGATVLQPSAATAASLRRNISVDAVANRLMSCNKISRQPIVYAANRKKPANASVPPALCPTNNIELAFRTGALNEARALDKIEHDAAAAVARLQYNLLPTTPPSSPILIQPSPSTPKKPMAPTVVPAVPSADDSTALACSPLDTSNVESTSPALHPRADPANSHPPIAPAGAVNENNRLHSPALPPPPPTASLDSSNASIPRTVAEERHPLVLAPLVASGSSTGPSSASMSPAAVDQSSFLTPRGPSASDSPTSSISPVVQACLTVVPPHPASASSTDPSSASISPAAAQQISLSAIPSHPAAAASSSDPPTDSKSLPRAEQAPIPDLRLKSESSLSNASSISPANTATTLDEKEELEILNECAAHSLPGSSSDISPSLILSHQFQVAANLAAQKKAYELEQTERIMVEAAITQSAREAAVARKRLQIYNIDEEEAGKHKRTRKEANEDPKEESEGDQVQNVVESIDMQRLAASIFPAWITRRQDEMLAAVKEENARLREEMRRELKNEFAEQLAQMQKRQDDVEQESKLRQEEMRGEMQKWKKEMEENPDRLHEVVPAPTTNSVAERRTREPKTIMKKTVDTPISDSDERQIQIIKQHTTMLRRIDALEREQSAKEKKNAELEKKIIALEAKLGELKMQQQTGSDNTDLDMIDRTEVDLATRQVIETAVDGIESQMQRIEYAMRFLHDELQLLARAAPNKKVAFAQSDQPGNSFTTPEPTPLAKGANMHPEVLSLGSESKRGERNKKRSEAWQSLERALQPIDVAIRTARYAINSSLQLQQGDNEEDQTDDEGRMTRTRRGRSVSRAPSRVSNVSGRSRRSEADKLAIWYPYGSTSDKQILPRKTRSQSRKTRQSKKK